MVNLYESVVRPALFRIPAGTAHDLAQFGLKWPLPWKLAGWRGRIDDDRLKLDLGKLALDNPVGLAPGFDKNGNLVRSLDQLGFGYLVIGSITRTPRQGNRKPRMFRDPAKRALINNLGLPSLGLDAVLHILKSLPRTRSKLLASVTGFTAAELIEAAAAVEPFVDAVELGLVCPNTTETHRMAELEIFEEVAEAVAAHKTKPVFVRLPPHHTEIEREQAMAIADICMRTGLEGVGTNGRIRVTDSRLPNGEGSISGPPTFADALRIVRDIAEHSEGRLAIRASGGVTTGADAAEMLRAGATSVEVYTSFVYRGPRVARLISSELLEIMERDNLGGLEELTAAARLASGEGSPGGDA